MSNEWKEIEIDDLEPDILTGDYDFMWDYMDDPFRKPELEKRLDLIKEKKSAVLVYRNHEPKQPTHEEIMTKWWDLGDGLYIKVLTYTAGNYLIPTLLFEHYFPKVFIEVAIVQKDWFIGRESADIPPEATE